MNNFLPKLKFLALLLVLMAGGTMAMAQKTATASGDWSNPATWTPVGVPTALQSVTINNGVTVTVDVSNAVCASITIPSGNDFTTLTINASNKLTIGGELNIGAPTDNSSHRTININGTLIAGSVVMANLSSNDDIRMYINNGGSMEVSGDVTMNGSNTENYLTLNTGGYMKLGGSLAGGNFAPDDGSTFEYSGDSPQTIGNYFFSNLILSGAGEKTLAANRTIDGDLEIKAGATLTLGIRTLTISDNSTPRTVKIDGRLNINNTGRLNEGGTGNKTLELGATGYLSLTGGSTLIPTYDVFDFSPTSTVEFGSGGSQTIENSITYGNLITSGSGTKTLETSGGSMSFLGSITIGNGTTLDGNDKTINVGGDWTSDGNFTLTNTSVVFNGSAVQNISGSNQHNFQNLTVNGAGVTLGRSVTVNGTLGLTSGVLASSDANLLSLATTATYSGSSNSSYVSGPMAKLTNSTNAFVFPVGNTSGGLRNVTVTPSSTNATSFVARSVAGSPQGAYAGGFTAPIQQLSYCEYWIVDRASGSADATVTLTWDNALCGGSYVNDPATLVVARFNGTDWVSEGNAGTTSNSITSNTVTSFSPFALGTTNSILNPLPVTFDQVRAYQRNSGVQIEWSNMTEKDVVNYTVEHSSDGQQFSTINQQSAKSNNDSREDYTAFDATPFNGANYYRIRVLETTGKIVYSKTLKVVIGGRQAVFTLYPNPVIGGQVTVGLSAAAGKYHLQVVSANGQVLQTQSLNHNGGNMSQQVQLPRSLKPGVYNMVISGDNYRESKMFVIQ